MHEDPEGYVWFCHYEGLSRFDGSGITVFYGANERNGLRSNTVYHVLVDPLNQYWMGTTRGLELFHPTNERFEHIPLDPREKEDTKDRGYALNIMDMVVLPGGKHLLVCCGRDGFFLVDLRTHRILPQNTQPLLRALKGIAGRRLFIDSRHRLWIVSDTLNCIDLTTLERRTIPLRAGNSLEIDKMEITDFLEVQPGGTLLVSDNWNGVLQYDEARRELVSFATHTIAQRGAQCLLKRKDGTLLVGFEKNGVGRIQLSSKSITPYHPQGSPIDLTRCKIHQLLEDRWGNLYMGIFQKGVLIEPAPWSGFRFRNVAPSHSGNTQAAVSSFVRRNDGTLFIGTDGDGIFYGKSPDEVSPLPLPADCNGSIQQLATEPNGRLWIASYGTGLFAYASGRMQKIADRDGCVNKNIICLLADPAHQKLYIGNVGSGLNQLDLATGTMTHLNNSPWVPALLLDSKGRLWFGGSRVNCYDLHQRTLLPLRLDDTQDCSVRTMVEWKGSIYIGSDKGLFVYNLKTDECHRFDLGEKGKATAVMSLAVGKDGALWMATNKGILQFQGKDKDVQWFSSYDIQRVGDFHNQSVYAATDGNVYFGGDNGFVGFKTAEIANTNSALGPIRFCGLNVNGESVSFRAGASDNLLDAAIGYATRVTLPKHLNSFALRFTAANYAAASQLRYRYRLEGYETFWHSTTADNPVAIYNSVPAGKYTLRVESLITNSKAPTAEASIQVVVHAAWYWSWWSKLLYAIVLLSIFYSRYQIYRIRLKSKERLSSVIGELIRTKENYRSFMQTQAANDQTPSHDRNEEFKAKIMDAIAQRLTDPNFSVEELSNEIALSRVHLYRRTKELFDRSPNELLKMARMKKAAILLTQGKVSISTVAYEVGYSEPSYFSKSFKGYFNMSPKEFADRYRNKTSDEMLRQLFNEKG
jgi:ligand-binding sensor domain-containing protein/AraC-like DNA-binding protein